MTTFEAKNINVVYGKKNQKHVVQDVSFSVDASQTLGIVGESGCGKTTLALALIGLLSKNAIVRGEISLDGLNYDLSNMDHKSWRKLRGEHISMIFQDSLASLNPLIPVGKQVQEAITEKQKLSKNQAKEKVIDLFQKVRIDDAENKMKLYPHQLSGGMRQRIMIAIAIANNPSVLICDEPTTSLDVSVQSEIINLLLSIQQDYEISMIFISHDLGVINAVSNKINVMYASKIMESGDTQEILLNPAHPYTQGLINAMPDLTGDRELAPIKGTAITPTEPLDFCPFIKRCPQAREQCELSMPDLFAIGAEGKHRNCACFFPLINKVGI